MRIFQAFTTCKQPAKDWAMRIYTRAGDQGETGLFGGERISKADRRIEAMGSVDELNAAIGWAETLLTELSLRETLRTIQSDLFTIGADLATPVDTDPAVAAKSARLDLARIGWLEAIIDEFEDGVPPLRNFILPGGAPGAAALQLCRAICRRAERQVVRLNDEDAIQPAVLGYMNRLSDSLFVLARWVNARAGIEEPVWKPAIPLAS
jgi:cob(I)alamin adenosyltransferase